ncbi:MAG TPA: AmmeMemoRadiSam system protein A [Candidatus Pacearchaeota archaeon]|nr:AmmeMemoRadiSam system protein A [Candidatus Pacearchaeota archaeon]HOL90145.1 AmmeMemoRadiSam system protein A [Candidatus Pacearchaeota archaeon]HPO68246.1 AmmeMemoRadiSam system protein A [Candidatus Pacearchaeota archaeon]
MDDKINFSEIEKKELLKIARDSVESFIKTGKIPNFEVNSEKLKEKRAAFVTILKNGNLRGCIGRIADDMPLFKVISKMAVAAAVEDYRFLPVNEDELKDLKYEISVLTPFKKINSIEEIEIGKHGVLAVTGNKTGLFLPQVATENNFDRETFLNELMMKIGLSSDYWKKNPIDFYVFEAEVFGD